MPHVSLDSLLQEVYAALLRKMGFSEVTVADDGQHAVDQVDKADFDVILMVSYLRATRYQGEQADNGQFLTVAQDVEMPRMNGPA